MYYTVVNSLQEGLHLVIYVDLAFLINLFIDASLLLITGSLLQRKLTMRRVFGASAIGSLYAVATLFPGTSMLRSVLVKWLFSVLMVDLAFGMRTLHHKTYRHLVKLMQVVAAFYAVTFAVAGAIYALHNVFATGGASLDGLALIGGQVAWWTSLSTVFLVLSIPLALLLVRFLWSFVIRSKRLSGQVVTMRFTLFGQEAQVQALIDTGNSLTDPITKTPVAVAKIAALESLLPPLLKNAMRDGIDPLAMVYQQTSELGNFATRISIVPYRGVAGNTGYLLAIRPDEAIACIDGLEISLAPLFIALQTDGFSMVDQFDCILPGSTAGLLVEGRESGVNTRSRTSSDETSHSSHTA